MTVEELYNKLKHEIEQGHGNNEVKIITNNSSLGARSSTKLKYANSGFDWESGQFNLVAEDRIIKSNVIEKSIESIELKPLRNPKNPE